MIAQKTTTHIQLTEIKEWNGVINVPSLVSIHSVIEFGLRRMRTMTPSLSYFVLFGLCSSCHAVKVKDIFTRL